MEADDLLSALDTALTGDWHRAHAIVQRDEADPLACWIHAVATAYPLQGPLQGMRRAVVAAMLSLSLESRMV